MRSETNPTIFTGFGPTQEIVTADRGIKEIRCETRDVSGRRIALEVGSRAENAKIVDRQGNQ
jgi:hypothetical protein